MSIADITEAELLQAIYDAANVPVEGKEPGTITTAEAAEHWGFAENKTRKILKRAVQEGQIRPDRIWRVNLWGITQTITGWRFVTFD